MKFHPVQSGVFLRKDGIIWTHQGTHGTPDAGIFHRRFLLDSVKGVILVGVNGILLYGCSNNSFLKDLQFNGLHRADRGALSAQGAPVIAVTNLPGQIVEA
jgi:hypothetical protein